MLLAIKDRITGIIAWFVVVLISVPFVLWGVQEYTGIGQDSFAVKVNGAEVTLNEFEREIARNRQQLLQSFGGRMPTYFDAESFLRTQTLAMLINRELYDQIIEDKQFRMAAQQVIGTITADPVFQTNGQFDPEAYAAEIRSRGLSKQGYEIQLRDQMLAMQIQDSIRKSAFFTPKEVAEYAKLRYQNREFEYLTIPLETYKKKISEVSSDDIEDYFTANADKYKTEERVRIEYVELDLAALAANVLVDDAKLTSAYQQAIEQGRFATGEIRNASHILVKVAADASEDVVAEKRKEIEVLRTRILEGESFAQLAKDISEDPGSASRGGSLGDVQRGAMVKPFEDALYAAEIGKITEPVKTRFGFHLILVDKVIESKVQPLEEVSAMLDQEIRRIEAEPDFYELLDTLANAAFENPDDLQIVSELIGVEVQSSDWFTVSVGKGIAENAAIRSAAFTDEVLKEGNNSTPIEAEPEHVVVLRIAEHEPSRTKTLSEATEQIRSTLTNEQASSELQQVANAIVDAAQSGDSLQKLAKIHGAKYKKVEINRDDTESPREVIQKAFTMHMSLPIEKISLSSGDSAVIKLNEVTMGDMEWLKADEQKKLITDLVKARGEYDLAAVIADVKDQAEIVIHPDLQ